MMTIISSLHNLSRSVGCAVLAASGKNLVLYFVGGEMLLFLTYKLVRRDYYHWVPLNGALAIAQGDLARIVTKVIAVFTGCLHMRHPYELGGAAFSTGMVWAQVSPFVALQFYEGDEKDNVTIFLISTLGLWLAVNTVFFCTIDLSFMNTIFGAMTAAQYTCVLYKTGDDSQKFDAIFSNRLQFTTSIQGEVTKWIAENLDRWKLRNRIGSTSNSSLMNSSPKK